MADDHVPTKKDEAPRCPACGSDHIAAVQYGFPNLLNPELKRAVDEGSIVLGGCVVSDGAERWKCRDCRKYF